MIDKSRVTVKRSRRKTISIYVERDGDLTILVPEKTTDEEVEAVIKLNEYKIYQFKSKQEMLNQRAVKREAVNGQPYLYLGRNYYLEFKSDLQKVELKGIYFYAPKVSKEKLTELFKDFYRTRGKTYLMRKVKNYASKMGINVEEIAVLDLKNRWASCSVKKPKINFHWKIMMAPVSVINYIVVHELSHFIHSHHNTEFWNTVDKILPDYRKQIAWLEEYGASLDV
jgi:predicted metal-dependent hydrolase